MNKNSYLYQEITLEEIQFLYEKALNITSPAAVSLLSGGLFNTTYRVICKESGMDTVLRLGPVNRHLLVRFEENLMEAENYVYKLCKEQGVVCSEVLVCDTSRVWIDRDFMIVSYIPSAAMCDAGLLDEQKLPLYREIGRLAKRMHCITSPTFGRVSEILSGLSFSRWSEYLLSELEDVCKRLVRDHGMETGSIKRFQQVIKKYQTWLDEIKIPRLVHTDLWEGNILLDQQKKERVVAIIDSDRAIFGDPDYDLACPWLTTDAFFEGYEVNANVFHKEEFSSIKRTTRRKIYNMMYCLLDAYVGLSEYNNPELYKDNMKRSFTILEELEIIFLH